MKISILTPDLSHNCLGRAYLLAKILQRRHEVEIAGPVFGDGIWEPVANDKSITYKSVDIKGGLRTYGRLWELSKKVDGDIIYASKPLLSSFGVGLLKKFSERKPLLLDIDDWQMGFMKEHYANLSLAQALKGLAYSAVHLHGTDSYWNALVGEKLTGLADKITVSNNFLKKKFGGTILCHGRDTEAFDPERFDKASLREKYGMDADKKVVMFLGSPRPHKGVEDLVESISLLQEHDVLLALVGADKDGYSRRLVGLADERLGGRFRAFGLQPFEMVPEFLAMADVVAVPQRRSPGSEGQVPAKVFDAMAMARPVVATAVSDLPGILEDCGWIVEPQNPEQLAKTIQYVLNNPGEAEARGRRAREKCIEKYSWGAMEKILLEIFQEYE